MTREPTHPRWTLILCSAALFVVAMAPTPGLLLGARAVQGVGAAAVMPLSLTILTSVFPPQRRGAVVGIWVAIGGLAVASGPVIGGAITQGIDWHWIFWVNVPMGAVAIAGSLLRLPAGRGVRARLDLPGLVLAGGAAATLVWGLMRSGERGATNTGALVTLSAGVLMLAALVAWERRAPEPMLAPRLFVQRTFAAANVGAFMMTAAVMGAAFEISQYFQFTLGDSPLATGLRLLPGPPLRSWWRRWRGRFPTVSARGR